jgi:hypothetical protein
LQRVTATVRFALFKILVDTAHLIDHLSDYRTGFWQNVTMMSQTAGPPDKIGSNSVLITDTT